MIPVPDDPRDDVRPGAQRRGEPSAGPSGRASDAPGDEAATAPQVPDRSPERDPRTGRASAPLRIQQQAQWVDLQLRRAIERGEFDDLPGAGKPIEDLGTEHDPDWWIKRLVERERITGVLPESLRLRKDDAELDRRLDRLGREDDVRRELEEFNARVLRARYRPPEGPPLVTMTRDVEADVAAWRERRRTRQVHRPAPPATRAPHRRRRRWWPFRR